MKRRIALALVVVVAALTACRESPSGLIVGTGNVQAWGGDCTGVWMVHADSGHNYEITKLAPEFQQQDLRVRFTLQPRQDVVSGCMVGMSADVVAMTRL
jgi:hypothetical protein